MSFLSIPCVYPVRDFFLNHFMLSFTLLSLINLSTQSSSDPVALTRPNAYANLNLRLKHRPPLQTGPLGMGQNRWAEPVSSLPDLDKVSHLRSRYNSLKHSPVLHSPLQETPRRLHFQHNESDGSFFGTKAC